MTDDYGDQKQSPLRYEGGVPVLPTPADRENTARNAEKKEQQEYNRKQVAIQRGIFGTQVALVIFGILGMAISAYQAHTARLSADLAARALTENRKQFDDTLAEMRAQTKAQQDAATDAGNSVIAARDQMRLDQRAWIGVGDVAATISATSPWGWSVTLYNTGKTPANRMSATGNWVILPRTTPLTEAAFKKGIFPPSTSQTSDLFPGAHEPLQAKYNILILNQSAETDEIKTGKKFLYVFGEVSYWDVFKAKHWARFCYMIGVDLKPLGECAIHNDSDADYPEGQPK